MTTRSGKAAARLAGWYGPREAGVEYVQDIIAMAGRAGLIPEEWVADTRAPEPVLPDLGPQTAEEEAAVVRAIIEHAGVTRDRQGGQDDYIELWCEADGLIDRLVRTATREHDVPVYSGGGFDGLKGKRLAAERIAGVPARRAHRRPADRRLRPARRTDPRRLRRRRRSVGDRHHGLDLAVVEFRTLALTEAQAIEHDLLDADGKAEADGIPVPVLDALVRDAIVEIQDPARREQVAADEEAENDRLPALLLDAVEECGRGGAVTNALIYCRVSRDKRDGRSTDEQETSCRDECARQGWTVVDVVTERDRSASRYAKRGRPGGTP